MIVMIIIKITIYNHKKINNNNDNNNNYTQVSR